MSKAITNHLKKLLQDTHESIRHDERRISELEETAACLRMAAAELATKDKRIAELEAAVAEFVWWVDEGEDNDYSGVEEHMRKVHKEPTDA